MTNRIDASGYNELKHFGREVVRKLEIGTSATHMEWFLNHTISDITNAHLTFPKGEQAHILVSWLHPYKEQKLIIIAEKTMLIFDDSQPWESKLQNYSYPKEWVDGLPKPCQSEVENSKLEPCEPLKAQAQHFLDCILEKRTPITDGKEAIRVLKVLLAAKNSINSSH